MDELIVYQSLRRPSVSPPLPQHFQSSTLEPPGQLNLNVMDAGTKVCTNGPGHMTKLAAMPVYGKTPLRIFFSRIRRLMTLGLGM